mmetsp:Transcript_14131/g.39797  ORF Transcript_14131/g.39797 Transcript_14131/m.39797 type:complete len:284 (-) Transcript_14131:877-1728(-)
MFPSTGAAPPFPSQSPHEGADDGLGGALSIRRRAPARPSSASSAPPLEDEDELLELLAFFSFLGGPPFIIIICIICMNSALPPPFCIIICIISGGGMGGASPLPGMKGIGGNAGGAAGEPGRDMSAITGGPPSSARSRMSNSIDCAFWTALALPLITTLHGFSMDWPIRAPVCISTLGRASIMRSTASGGISKFSVRSGPPPPPPPRPPLPPPPPPLSLLFSKSMIALLARSTASPGPLMRTSPSEFLSISILAPESLCKEFIVSPPLPMMRPTADGSTDNVS